MRAGMREDQIIPELIGVFGNVGKILYRLPTQSPKFASSVYTTKKYSFAEFRF